MYAVMYVYSLIMEGTSLPDTSVVRLEGFENNV